MYFNMFVYYTNNSRGLILLILLQLCKYKTPFKRSPWDHCHVLLQNIEYNTLLLIRTAECRYTNSKHTKTYSSLAVLTPFYIYNGKIVDWHFRREKGASKAPLGKSNLVDCICRASHICWRFISVHFKLWYSTWVIFFKPLSWVKFCSN